MASFTESYKEVTNSNLSVYNTLGKFISVYIKNYVTFQYELLTLVDPKLDWSITELQHSITVINADYFSFRSLDSKPIPGFLREYSIFIFHTQNLITK